MAIGRELSGFEEKIGYRFSDITLLENALTHSSYANEKKQKGINIRSNERLEFLGDAALQISISELLFSEYENIGEGALTKMRQFLVCEKTLSAIAMQISLGDYLNVGRGEENGDFRHRPKVLADALEAVLGAIYLDSKSKKDGSFLEIIHTLFSDSLKSAKDKQSGDFKTMLQEIVEKDGMAILEYVVTDETGPQHDKSFTVVAKVNNNIVGKGTAKSKKMAQMYAAKDALKLFGVL